MIHRMRIVLCAFLLLLPAGALATSIGVPVAPEGGDYLVGFEVESMEDRIGDENIRSIRYLGRITTRVREPLSVYFRLGGSEIDVDSEIHGLPTTFEGRPKLSLGLGAGYRAPLPPEKLSFFADAGALYTLSSGSTNFTTTVQSSVFHEEYENRYRWFEYQVAGGVHRELPLGGVWIGVLGRAVDGNVSRKTYQAGALVSSSSDGFNKGVELFGLFGVDFRLPGRMVLSLGGSGWDRDHFTWTVSIIESSR